MTSINETQHMTSNEQAVRNAYAIAEAKDIQGWIDCFIPDGVFVDNSIEVTYRGPDVSKPVEYYGAAFSDMHRELYEVYVSGNVVAVQLALQGYARRSTTSALRHAACDRQAHGRSLL